MPPVRFVQLGDIRMAIHEAGPQTGLPVILCHGFPETAYSWRRQITALAGAGWRTVAPDLRGFGATSRPAPVEAYDAEQLCDDMVRLLDELGADKGVFAGHDWGGALVWQLAVRRPERVAGVIGLNTPHLRRPPADPIAIMRRRMGPDMYIVRFQEPDVDAILDQDVARTLGFFFRRPPPGPAQPSAFPLVNIIQAYDPARDTRAPFLTPEEFQVYVDAFTASGFSGGLGWYRNMTRNWETAAAYDPAVRQPALMIMAEQDAILPPSAADGMEALVPDLEKVLIRGSGHWTQQEQPEAVNEAMLDWLERRFR